MEKEVRKIKRENLCIYCLRSDGGFEHKAHLIPESACNESLFLPDGCECDRCNQIFSPIEQQVIRSIPGQFFRVALVNKTKRGNAPTAAFKGGRIKRFILNNLPFIRFIMHGKNPSVCEPKIEYNRHSFTITFPNPSVRKISTFLARLSLGYFCLKGVDVYSSDYQHLRECIWSVGSSPFIPFLIGLHAKPTQEIQLIGNNSNTSVKTRPVRVRFPGFSGIMPTAQTMSGEILRKLYDYCQQEMPGHILICDPNWNKPFKINFTLKPGTEAVLQQFKIFYNSL